MLKGSEATLSDTTGMRTRAKCMYNPAQEQCALQKTPYNRTHQLLFSYNATKQGEWTPPLRMWTQKTETNCM